MHYVIVKIDTGAVTYDGSDLNAAAQRLTPGHVSGADEIPDLALSKAQWARDRIRIVRGV